MCRVQQGFAVVGCVDRSFDQVHQRDEVHRREGQVALLQLLVAVCVGLCWRMQSIAAVEADIE